MSSAYAANCLIAYLFTDHVIRRGRLEQSVRCVCVSTEAIRVNAHHEFYHVFNSRAKAANSEIIIVELMKAYCLPLIRNTY